MTHSIDPPAGSVPPDRSSRRTTLRLPIRSAVVALFALLGSGTLLAAPEVVSPAPGERLSGTSETFVWSADGRDVTAWFLNLGSSPGSRDIASSGRLTGRTSLTIDGLPRDGSDVHARLFAYADGGWSVSNTRYVAASATPGNDDPPPAYRPLVLGRDATPPSTAWTRPQLGVTDEDPVHATPVRRVTDADGTRFDRNTYSRRQAENANGSRFLTYHGTSLYRVYERRSLALVRELGIHPDSEPQWHPSDPDVIRHVRGSDASSGDLRLYETRVGNGKTRVIADLTDRLRAVYPTATHMKDKAEGSPSADGDHYAWIVFDRANAPLGIVSYDLGNDRVLGTRRPRRDAGALDWVSASPSGRHVMGGYATATVVYDRDLGNARRVNNKADHSDIAIDADGRDAYVYIDFSNNRDAGWLVSVDLATLQRTRLIDLYDGANTSLHVSGKAFDKPGWVLVSTYGCKVDGAWTCEKVMAVEMKDDPTIVNLAHTYNCDESAYWNDRKLDVYWTEPHAVVNRSFTRAYYNSDAGRCSTTGIEVYELSLPALP